MSKMTSTAPILKGWGFFPPPGSPLFRATRRQALRPVVGVLPPNGHVGVSVTASPFRLDDRVLSIVLHSANSNRTAPHTRQRPQDHQTVGGWSPRLEDFVNP